MTALGLAILAALQIADIAITNRIIKAGGRELNGVVAWLMARLGGGWGAAKYVIAMGAAIWAATAGYPLLIWIANAIFIGVVSWNWGQLDKLEDAG